MARRARPTLRSLRPSLRRLIIALGDDVCGFRFFPSAGFPA